MQTEGICPWSNMVNAEFYDVTIIYQSMSEFRQTGFLGHLLGRLYPPENKEFAVYTLKRKKYG